MNEKLPQSTSNLTPSNTEECQKHLPADFMMVRSIDTNGENMVTLWVGPPDCVKAFRASSMLTMEGDSTFSLFYLVAEGSRYGVSLLLVLAVESSVLITAFRNCETVML